jgi:hypothetical protein
MLDEDIVFVLVSIITGNTSRRVKSSVEMRFLSSRVLVMHGVEKGPGELCSYVSTSC